MDFELITNLKKIIKTQRWVFILIFSAFLLVGFKVPLYENKYTIYTEINVPAFFENKKDQIIIKKIIERTEKKFKHEKLTAYLTPHKINLYLNSSSSKKNKATQISNYIVTQINTKLNNNLDDKITRLLTIDKEEYAELGKLLSKKPDINKILSFNEALQQKNNRLLLPIKMASTGHIHAKKTRFLRRRHQAIIFFIILGICFSIIACNIMANINIKTYKRGNI